MIDGFGFTGCRSFSSDLQLFAPLNKVNLLAGQNNAGKSNAVRFAARYLTRGSDGAPPLDLNVPRGNAVRTSFEYSVACRLDLAMVEKHLSENGAQLPGGVRERMQMLLDLPVLHMTGDDLIWFRYEGRGLAQSFCVAVQEESARDRQHNPVGVLSNHFTNHTGGSPGEDARRVLNLLDPRPRLPEVTVVEAFRQISPGTPTSSGVGLIEELAKLQNPDELSQDLKLRFEGINHFLQTVLDDPDAQLEVPYGRNTLLVHQGGATLPLEHYGTGVHQVVILAAAATIRTGQLVCIEEPEVHLHPLLQRKLVRYLRDHTDNQYLITTHSAQMLDYERATVFHLQRTPEGTRVDPAVTPVELSALCADLGYRPSDLLQANAVIWVEGPSDRLYVRHWLQQLAPDLVEGIDYSIMFYGGRLLSHLTALDVAVDDFISLRRLNRHSAILIDSDKTSRAARLNQTKTRVRQEFDDGGPGFAWITHGYTIENYIPRDVLAAAVAKVHPKATLDWTGDPYTNPLRITAAKSKPRQKLDKVGIAHAVCQMWADPATDSRLTKNIARLVQFVHHANGQA